MNINEILTKVKSDFNAWIDRHKPEDALYLSDAISHLNECVIDAKYHDKSTVDDVLKNIRIFLEQSKSFPDVAKKSRIYIGKQLNDITNSIKAQPLKESTNKVLSAVENHIDKLPSEEKDKYSDSFIKLEKLFEFVTRLNQKNVNLPDLLLSQYKFQSLGFPDEQRNIFNNIYKVASNELNRDQILGQKDAIISAHTMCNKLLSEPHSPSFKLGFSRALMDIIDYKGNDINLLTRTMLKESKLKENLSEDNESRELEKGKIAASEAFIEHYVSPNKKRHLEKEPTEPAM